jgi:hypothetical protein
VQFAVRLPEASQVPVAVSVAFEPEAVRTMLPGTVVVFEPHVRLKLYRIKYWVPGDRSVALTVKLYPVQSAVALAPVRTLANAATATTIINASTAMPTRCFIWTPLFFNGARHLARDWPESALQQS